MTDKTQQAPEIYALHTVPNEGETLWFGIYAVRADAEHDAKVMRDATGRDWSVVRLVVADAAATPTGPITRYEVVDCIDSKHVPAVIPNGAGPWVRYEDHVAALVEAQQPAKAESLRQILTDPENQPNQYGVEFGMSGQQMHFKIGNQLFRLAYEPDDQQEFEFMKRMLIHAFSTFTPDVGMAQHPATHVQKPAEIEHVAGDVSKNGSESNMAPQPPPSAAAASKAVLAAIRAANMQLVRTGDDEFMLVTLKQATPQAGSQPAPVLDYPPLPRVGAIGYASVVDIQIYAKTLTIGPHLPGVRDIALWTTDQMRAYVDADRAARAKVVASLSVSAGSEPVAHIKEPYTLAEIKAKIASNYYSAEMLLQHAMLLLDSASPPEGMVGGWQDISTAPKDGTRFVAVGNNYGLYSEAQHTCIAQWFRGRWMEVSEWNEDSELKYLTHWMPLLPLPGTAARKQGGA